MKKYPKSLSQVAEQRLIDMIISGKLQLGDRVTETELASMLSMSTAPVHQALHALSRMGIVRVKARKGTYIFNFTIDDIKKMTRARFAIESEALRQACRNNHSRFCLDMSNIISKSNELGGELNLKQYLKHDAEFHELFFTHADNEFLTMAINAITIKVMVLWYLTISDNYTTDDMFASIMDHQKILDSVLKDDIDNACMILKEHFYRLENIYLRDKV